MGHEISNRGWGWGHGGEGEDKRFPMNIPMGKSKTITGIKIPDNGLICKHW